MNLITKECGIRIYERIWKKFYYTTVRNFLYTKLFLQKNEKRIYFYKIYN